MQFLTTSKGGQHSTNKCYVTMGMSYIIHTLFCTFLVEYLMVKKRTDLI